MRTSGSTDRQRSQVALLQRAVNQQLAQIPKELEARVEVNGEAVPGCVIFQMSIIAKGQRLSQRAHVPMSMVELMVEAAMPAFALELVEGAFDPKNLLMVRMS